MQLTKYFMHHNLLYIYLNLASDCELHFPERHRYKLYVLSLFTPSTVSTRVQHSLRAHRTEAASMQRAVLGQNSPEM